MSLFKRNKKQINPSSLILNITLFITIILSNNTNFSVPTVKFLNKSLFIHFQNHLQQLSQFEILQLMEFHIYDKINL